MLCRHLEIVRSAHSVEYLQEFQRLDPVVGAVRDHEVEVGNLETKFGQRTLEPRFDVDRRVRLVRWHL